MNDTIKTSFAPYTRQIVQCYRLRHGHPRWKHYSLSKSHCILLLPHKPGGWWLDWTNHVCLFCKECSDNIQSKYQHHIIKEGAFYSKRTNMKSYVSQNPFFCCEMGSGPPILVLWQWIFWLSNLWVVYPICVNDRKKDQ